MEAKIIQNSQKRGRIKTAIIALSIMALGGLFSLSGTGTMGYAASLAERKVPKQFFMSDTQGYNAAMWELVTMAMESWKKELGVTFEREVLTHSELNAKGLFGGKFDVKIQGYSGTDAMMEPGFALPARFYATCPGYYPRIPKEQCPGGGGSFNCMGYYNPEVNKLLKAQGAIFDYQERKKVTDKIVEMVAQDRPTLYLFSPSMVQLMNTKNWEGEKSMMGDGLACFWNSIGIKPKGNEKTLRVGSNYTVPTLNPMACNLTQAYRVAWLIYDRLMRIDLTGKPVNWMAENVTSTDGPKGPNTTILIKLREDLKFHDGVQLTAEDVKYSFDFAKQYKAPDFAAYINTIASVETQGKYAVKINLEEPWAPVFHILLSRVLIIPKHIWEKVAKEVANPIEWGNETPVGSGPFKFSSWERGSQLVLVKNKDYFYPVGPERIVRVDFQNLESLATAIERGEIDVQWGESMLTSIVLRTKKNPNIKIVNAPNHAKMVFDLRVDKRPYSDPVFRKALDYSLPKKKMIQEIYDGFADPCNSELPPANKAWHNPKVFDFAVEYNPEKARQILKEAGYEWDADGNLCYPNK